MATQAAGGVVIIGGLLAATAGQVMTPVRATLARAGGKEGDEELKGKGGNMRARRRCCTV